MVIVLVCAGNGKWFKISVVMVNCVSIRKIKQGVLR